MNKVAVVQAAEAQFVFPPGRRRVLACEALRREIMLRVIEKVCTEVGDGVRG